MKIILFNGPPGCGKDEAGKALNRICPIGFTTKFAKAVKDGVHSSLNLCVPHDYFEKVKDKEVEEFHWQVPRQAYISYSEDYMKPNFGKDVFGKLTRNELASMIGSKASTEYDNLVIGITDSGFAEEAQVLIDWAGRNNVVLVKLSREGCSFEGDSRDYIDLPVRTYSYANDGTIEQLENFVRLVVRANGIEINVPSDTIT